MNPNETVYRLADAIQQERTRLEERRADARNAQIRAFLAGKIEGMTYVLGVLALGTDAS